MQKYMRWSAILVVLMLVLAACQSDDPGTDASDEPDESVAAYGPDVPFTYSFPLPGKYLVWIQVERDYEIVTVPDDLRYDLAMCRKLGKPTFVGEFGLSAAAFGASLARFAYTGRCRFTRS